jgi:hypothetical protein
MYNSFLLHHQTLNSYHEIYMPLKTTFARMEVEREGKHFATKYDSTNKIVIGMVCTAWFNHIGKNESISLGNTKARSIPYKIQKDSETNCQRLNRHSFAF